MRTVMVTGCDSAYFLMACMLEQSLSRGGYKGEFAVLDFGLNPKQRDFLRRKGTLRERPETIDSGTHPYVLKTRMASYLLGMDPNAVFVWIDSDIIVGNQFPTRLDALCGSMAANGHTLAASPAWTLDEFLVKFPGLNIDPFKERLGDAPTAGRSYFNSGFIVFKGLERVEKWERMAKSVPFHGVYDQNIFNLVAYAERGLTGIPRSLWNFHDTDFDDMSKVSFNGEQEIPYVLHFTSSRENHFGFFGCVLEGDPGTPNQVRLSHHKPVRDLQFALLDQFLRSDGKDLSGSGLLNRKSGMQDGALAWNVRRNDPCPCLSGSRYKQCHGRL